MYDRSTRARSGKKPRLRLLDLELHNEERIEQKENILQNSKRPHGGYKGSKKHPLSPYSYNKNPEYLRQIKDNVEQIYQREFLDGHKSPGWAVDTSREVTHSGEYPLYIHGLLSSSKYDMRGTYTPESSARKPIRGQSAPPKRNNKTEFIRPNSTHQYLSATELRQTSASDVDSKYGRPTRTTLLRARQRSNSSPSNSYLQRREYSNSRRVETPTQPNSSREYSHISKPSTGQESVHAFLTGARYNRAHLLDSRGMTVYGVYMPRKNPLACFMTGAASNRIKERSEQTPSAPPETPRSEAGDAHDTRSEPEEERQRPSTAPGKRLLSAKTPPRERPKSAWGDASTSCDIVNTESEILNLQDEYMNQQILEDLVLIPNGLNVQGSRVVVTLKSNKPSSKAFESKLPSVTGISVPKVNIRRRCDPVEETSMVNQPPPTPVGGLSRAESEHLQQASMSVKNSQTRDDMTSVSQGQQSGVDKATDVPQLTDLEISFPVEPETDEVITANEAGKPEEITIEHNHDVDENHKNENGEVDKAQTKDNENEAFEDTECSIQNTKDTEEPFFVTEGEGDDAKPLEDKVQTSENIHSGDNSNDKVELEVNKEYIGISVPKQNDLSIME